MTVAELRHRMSAREFEEWKTFYRYRAWAQEDLCG